MALGPALLGSQSSEEDRFVPTQRPSRIGRTSRRRQRGQRCVPESIGGGGGVEGEEAQGLGPAQPARSGRASWKKG